MKRIWIAAHQLARCVFRLFRRSGRAVTYGPGNPIAVGAIACILVACTVQLQAQVNAGIPDAFGTTTQKPKKKLPLDLVLRSIAVLEWTGAAGKPDSSLLVPVAIYTDDEFIDGDNYLADPVPMAVQNGTQYILQRSGEPQGSYDLDAAGKLRGEWFASGTWEPLDAKNPYASAANSKPTGSKGSAMNGDPDRPHFATDDNTGPDGQELPTLHLRPPKNAPKPPPPDPNRPIMAYGKPPKKLLADFVLYIVPAGSTTAGPAASVSSAAKPGSAARTPRQQMVAISDAATRDATNWAYPWPTDAARNALQQKMELLAQNLLQSSRQANAIAEAEAEAEAAKTTAAPPPPDPTPRLVQRPKPKPATLTPQTAAQIVASSQLPGLHTTDFRCFAMTQAKPPAQPTPTCVLSAQSIADDHSTRYVTLIAQPDIYGAPKAISQSFGDAAHLDAQPRVRLVDVVDAAANHQPDFLIEIDRAENRQFGIYTVSDGKVKLAYMTPDLPF